MFKFNNLGLGVGMVLKFYTSVTKRLNVKVGMLWGLTLTVVEVTGEKLVGGPFCLLPMLNRVNILKGRVVL